MSVLAVGAPAECLNARISIYTSARTQRTSLPAIENYNGVVAAAVVAMAGAKSHGSRVTQSVPPVAAAPAARHSKRSNARRT